MAHLICADNLSHAWLAAMTRLRGDGTAVNLNVAWQGGNTEDERVRAALDAFLASSKTPVYGVETVADTIFPESFYHPHLGREEAFSRLVELNSDAMRLHRRRSDSNDRETYFNRLVDYPSVKGQFNQLEYIIDRLTTKVGKPGSNSSAYEMGLSDAGEGTGLVDLRIQAPGKDRNYYRFPCLSHISITLAGRTLNFTATYRNQTFVSRAYGNYLGLSRLACFIAEQTDGEVGEIQCVATHASIEYGTFGKRNVTALLDRIEGAGDDA